MVRRALGTFLATLASVAALRFPVPGFAGARKPPPAATQLRDALLAADSEPLDRVKIDGLVSDLSAMRVPFQGLGCATPRTHPVHPISIICPSIAAVGCGARATPKARRRGGRNTRALCRACAR